MLILILVLCAAFRWHPSEPTTTLTRVLFPPAPERWRHEVVRQAEARAAEELEEERLMMVSMAQSELGVQQRSLAKLQAKLEQKLEVRGLGMALGRCFFFVFFAGGSEGAR